MNKKFIILIVVVLLLFPICHLSGENNQHKSIHLDCNEVNGLINHYSEINCGPLPNHDHMDGVDLTTQYQEIGIDFIRNHDFSGPTDISTIFPDFSADPTDPASYNFTSSDYHIKSIIDAGSKVFYRLGESASINETLRQPPADFNKWAEICKHVIMHYNDGWADGYYFDITYFEIWNEPDLSGFWNGTAKEYYELYHTTVETLKAYNPQLKIGGPCTSSVYNENFTSGFLTYLVQHDLPLDFYSWHMYASHPHDLYNGSKHIRSLLDSFGFVSTESINTEWNINIIFPQRDKDNAKNAAFTASSVTIFQDAAMDYAFRYRGNGDGNRLVRSIGFDLSLFSPGGLYKTPTLIYKIADLMEQKTPIRLQTPQMDGLGGLEYLAGRSEDASTVSILISNYESGVSEYELVLESLPQGSSYTLVHFVIDDDHNFQIMDQRSIESSTVEFSGTIQSSSVHFIWITSSSIIPEEGPEVASIPFLLQLKILDIPRAILAMILMMIFFG